MTKVSWNHKKKYDINHKIFEALANLESRIILFAIVKNSKTAETISFENKLPLSSVYYKIQNLEGLGLIEVDKIEHSHAGRITKLYKSRIRGITMNLKSSEPKIKLTPT